MQTVRVALLDCGPALVAWVSMGVIMTDTLRGECEAFAKKVDTTIADSLVTGKSFDLDDLTNMVLAFARAQQAKAFKEAALNTIQNFDAFENQRVRNELLRIWNWCKAQATAREAKEG